MTIKDLVEYTQKRIRNDRIFFAPNIPIKKLQRAINRYAKDVLPDTVFMFIETTTELFEWRTGLLLTDTAVYAKYYDGIFTTKVFFLLEDVLRVDYHKTFWCNGVLINDGAIFIGVDNKIDDPSFNTIFGMFTTLADANNQTMMNNDDKKPKERKWVCSHCSAENTSVSQICEYCGH